MLHWSDCGAYTFDICNYMIESPFVRKRGGRYYLFFTNCGHGTAYAVSDDPVSGWKDARMLIGARHPDENAANVPSCAEAIRFKGKWYVSCCERQPGCEQYLELFELIWLPDGTVRLGDRVNVEEV